MRLLNRFFLGNCLILLLLSDLSASGQPTTLSDPLAGIQENVFRSTVQGAGEAIDSADVLTYAQKTFSRRAAELENAELLRTALEDPRSRGNLRGRIAEEDWIKRNSRDGWSSAANPIDPQTDAVRRVNGEIVERAQVKTHQNWRNYITSMEKDDLADYFVLPDDHFEQVYGELETRRSGALRGRDEALKAGQSGRAEELARKADRYRKQQQRLVKIGRTFSEYDLAIDTAIKHYSKISLVFRASNRIVPFLGIAVSVVDGGIAVFELANGQTEVEEVVTRMSANTAATAFSAVAYKAAMAAATSAGATGNAPVAVAVVVAAGTFVVVDWGVRELVDSMAVAHLTAEDIAGIWPEGLRGVSLEGIEGGVSLEGIEGGASLEGIEGGVSLEGIEGGVSLEGIEGGVSLQGLR